MLVSTLSNTMLLICYSSLLYFLAASAAETDPLVTTPLGKVRGTTLTSRDGLRYYAFKSIPYAKPPVGGRRLMSPEAVDPWEGVLNGTEDPVQCLQSPVYVWHKRNETSGSENCLFLNVFTPELSQEKLAPVMVYIHGGGFRMGAPPSRAADFLIDEGVVLVTIQYRLGPLGFLSMEDSTIPGNFGLKDQAMALKWINRYISNFGGDPKRVTVFGESAGGISTHLLMRSSLSKGLLKGAVSQSGTVYFPCGIHKPGEGKQIAEKTAKMFGCHSNSSKEVLSCLQRVDPVKLTRADLDFLVFDSHPVFAFTAVIEEPGPGAFITKKEIFSETDLPWIAGMATNEGASITGSLRAQKEKFDYDFLRTNLNMVIGAIIGLRNDTLAGNKAVSAIKNHFFQKSNDYGQLLTSIAEFCSAIYFTCPLYKSLPISKGPTYLYLNDYRAGSTWIDLFGHQEVDSGATHSDENILLMNQRNLFVNVKPNEDAVSKKLVRLWANFAKFQNPSPDSESEIQWPVSNKGDGHVFLRFNECPKLETDYKKSMIELCNSIPQFS